MALVSQLVDPLGLSWPLSPAHGSPFSSSEGTRMRMRSEPNEFWMLSLYAKSKQENVPGHILKQLLEAFRNG